MSTDAEVCDRTCLQCGAPDSCAEGQDICSDCRADYEALKREGGLDSLRTVKVEALAESGDATLTRRK